MLHPAFLEKLDSLENQIKESDSFKGFEKGRKLCLKHIQDAREKTKVGEERNAEEILKDKLHDIMNTIQFVEGLQGIIKNILTFKNPYQIVIAFAVSPNKEHLLISGSPGSVPLRGAGEVINDKLKSIVEARNKKELIQDLLGSLEIKPLSLNDLFESIGKGECNCPACQMKRELEEKQGGNA